MQHSRIRNIIFKLKRRNLKVKKIRCKIYNRRGYLVLDDDKTFLGTVCLWSDNPEEHEGLKWRWESGNSNAYGSVARLKDSYRLLKLYKE